MNGKGWYNIEIVQNRRFGCYCLDLTRFNKIAIQGTPQMAVDKEARAYQEYTHIVILSVPCPYTVGTIHTRPRRICHIYSTNIDSVQIMLHAKLYSQYSVCIFFHILLTLILVMNILFSVVFEINLKRAI